MGLLDVFSFKKEGAKLFTKENFKSVLELARTKIIEQAKAKIPGQEKKAIVDYVVITKIESFAAGCKNKIILWVINKLIEIVPTVTQLIYDFLKEKVEKL